MEKHIIDPHNKLREGNEPTSHPIYLIQMNPSVQTDSQDIPLHILENISGIDGLLPLLQDNNGQPLLLIESTEAPYVYNKKDELQMTPSNERLNSSTSVTSTECVENNTNVADDYLYIQSGGTEFVENVTVATESQSNGINQKAGDHTAGTNEKQLDSTEIYNKINFDKMHRPTQKIKNYVHISDVKAPPRAVAVLPSALQIRGSSISPRRSLSACVRFGPVQGIRKTITRLEAHNLLSNNTNPVFLLREDENYVTHIDVSDKDKSNWMGLLPLGDDTASSTLAAPNVWLYEENHELYAITTQPIRARRPLRLGYSKAYAEGHGAPPGPPVLDLDTVKPVQWWCNECNRGMHSAALLQKHTDVYHMDYTRTSRSSYRCRYCKRCFCRLFALKRHMLANCLKKPRNSPEKNQQSSETIQTNEPELSSVLEENRIPSDESFQNFASGLDFSTSLFDTDRIAGLDMSTNSHAHGEMNPYSIGFKDQNELSDDLNFPSNELEHVESGETNPGASEPLVNTCTYCKQVVVKENTSKHLRQCPSRLICECGRVFRHKKSLAQHIRKCHPSTAREKTVREIPVTNDKDLAYKCHECPYGVKRRGMLVNHLWRVHKLISTTPVEKRVRHYPCTACSKIYRSASKRDRHVLVHHPGVERPRGQWIEGGVTACQPAACAACPRQYASRAKLLQHVRQRHPHLAKTMKNQAIKKQRSKMAKSEHQSKIPPRKPAQERSIYHSNSANMFLS